VHNGPVVPAVTACVGAAKSVASWDVEDQAYRHIRSRLQAAKTMRVPERGSSKVSRLVLQLSCIAELHLAQQNNSSSLQGVTLAVVGVPAAAHTGLGSSAFAAESAS
jgi:hypothetical protein